MGRGVPERPKFRLEFEIERVEGGRRDWLIVWVLVVVEWELMVGEVVVIVCVWEG